MTLAEALACRPARARRAAAARRFKQAWQALPEIAGCLARLDALGGTEPAAAGALDAVRPLIENDAWLGHMMAELARMARQDPLFEPPFRPIGGGDRQQGLELIRHRLATLSAILLRPRAQGGAATIGFPGRRSLVRFVRGAGAAVDLWRVDGSVVRADGRRVLTNGAVLASDGVSETWTLAHGDVLILQAVASHGPATATEYDRVSGRPLTRNAGDTGPMRLQLMATLLRQLGRVDAVPAIAAAMAEGPPHTRWHLMRELVALNHRAARPLLAGMATTDPADELRDLATRTLAILPA